MDFFTSGIALGFICLQSLAYFGKRADEIGWVLSWFFAPFSGAFYPLEVLPAWAQVIGKCLPMGYAIDGMREYLMVQEDPMPYIIQAYALSVVYAVISIAIFACIFHNAKQKGLVRLFN